jgi:hypothetical protein
MAVITVTITHPGTSPRSESSPRARIHAVTISLRKSIATVFSFFIEPTP